MYFDYMPLSEHRYARFSSQDSYGYSFSLYPMIADSLHKLVAHILLACRRYAGKRTRHLGQVPPTITLKDLLGENSRWVQDSSIFSFVLDICCPGIFSSY